MCTIKEFLKIVWRYDSISEDAPGIQLMGFF